MKPLSDLMSMLVYTVIVENASLCTAYPRLQKALYVLLLAPPDFQTFRWPCPTSAMHCINAFPKCNGIIDSTKAGAGRAQVRVDM